MKNRISVTFRVRDKGGPSAGKTISRIVPDFDLTSFMKTPNAEAFVRKAYFATVKKIIREVEEKKNGSVASDLNSTEAVIARSLAFTREEVSDWLESRDWARASEVKDIGKLLPLIKEQLLELATRRNPFSKKVSDRLADIVVAAVADNPDPVAEFLFTVLSTQQPPEDEDFLGL